MVKARGSLKKLLIHFGGQLDERYYLCYPNPLFAAGGCMGHLSLYIYVYLSIYNFLSK